jgi:hypothetical protein
MSDQILDDVYFSVDGEFDGTHPPRHSMLSVGVVAFTLRNGVIDEWTRNIFPLVQDTRHESHEAQERRSAWLQSIGLPTGHTMSEKVWNEFWSRFPEAWAACNEDRVVPVIAMKEFEDFFLKHSKPRSGAFFEYPGPSDFFWCHWYFCEFLGNNPFGHSGQLGMKSWSAAVLKKPVRHAGKRNMPKRWFASKLPHTHIALDDARQQAHMGIRALCEHLDVELPPL